MPIRDGGVADPLREIVGVRVDVDFRCGREDALLDDAAEGRGAADLVREGLAEHHAPEVDLAARALVVLRVDERFVLRPSWLSGAGGGRDVHAPLEHSEYRVSITFIGRENFQGGIEAGGNPLRCIGTKGKCGGSIAFDNT